MNQVNKKRFIQGAVASAIFALSVPASALKTDTQQPMTINSVKQSLDLEKMSPHLLMMSLLSKALLISEQIRWL